jgi:hypothetical protein
VLLVWSYYQFGLSVALGVLAGSGISILGFFVGLWDKVKDPLTKRLDYLNQHAFTPLFTWCNSGGWGRITPNFNTPSNAAGALQAHRRYLTAGLYPKKLLELTEWVDQNKPEYDHLWTDLYNANEKWVQGHLNEWAHYSTAPDMPSLSSLLGFPLPGFRMNPEVEKLLRPFVEDYRQNNGKQLDQFVALHRDFLNKRSAMLTVLNAYMGTNMLHKPTGLQS